MPIKENSQVPLGTGTCEQEGIGESTIHYYKPERLPFDFLIHACITLTK